VKQQNQFTGCRKETLASHSHNTSRKGNSTSVGDTLKFRGRQRRSNHYSELQYDADWPEVLTEGRSLSQSYKVMPMKALSV
jgi:hypothetical protein